METIVGRARDLGGFMVQRVLPFATHRMVGPFIFFDHMGPAELPRGEGMDVRPHPHIHLATVTYLYKGKIFHRDSLGSEQLIEPGAINWMTAGRGIVHSERSPEDARAEGVVLDGIQCWVALPAEHEETEPSFKHHPSATLPEFNVGRARLKLLLGKAFDHASPVRVHSDLFYVDAFIPAGARLEVPLEGREGAVYVARGKVESAGQAIERFSMTVAKPNEGLIVTALEDTRAMILGGKPVGERFIDWNFVSSSKEAITAARAEWANGPGTPGGRFPKIAGDDRDFTPLPPPIPHSN